MGTWQPITEAPKDGQWFLAWGPEDEDYDAGIGIVFFRDGILIEPTLSSEDIVPYGFYSHWQPLPEPPHD